MVKEVLTGAGFIEGKTFKECRFLKPPATTYAVYMDSYDRRGADNLNLIKEHGYAIELYSAAPDKQAEARIERSLDNLGIAYEKQERYWLESEGLYQVIYNFDYMEK